METSSKLAVAYAMNALWQLPLLVLVTEVMVRLLGWAPGKVLHRVWLGFLFLALTVPAMSFLRMPYRLFGSGTIHRHTAAVAQTPESKKSLHLSFPTDQFEDSKQKPQRAADLPGSVSGGALLLYLGSVLFALSRLAWGLRKTQTLMHSTEEIVLTKEAQETCRCSVAGFDEVRRGMERECESSCSCSSCLP
jgi:hypothetical protein